MAIRILIADEHRIVREAIISMLENEGDIQVIGEAEDGRTAVEMALELQPDIVIIETSLPNLNGIEATRQIIGTFPDIKIIALSGHSDNRSVYEMLRAGAMGYVPKQCAFSELILAIRNVISNKVYMSTQISGIVVDGYLNRQPDSENSPYLVLTARAREVLQLIADGKSTKVIARELFVSVKTVEWHRSQLMKKLRMQSVAELVKYAIREGLTQVYV
jgi:DNA-binding NarL/FixJ family response regulator